ncbi:response regulator [Legionella sp. CNM-1927-20]|uniref:response regulator n=1 Tax=Legionella sp. CNM-1927-20 TaxID=3422221 RepID=UPI00403B2BEF
MGNEFCAEHSLFKIGIIEDSEIHREWLNTELLDDPKFIVVSTNKLGRDGIESVKKYEPDLVILDFQLQDMTGLEVSKRIKSYYPNIKIFVLTAHNEPSIIERLINNKHIDAIAIKGSPYFEINFLTAVMHVIEGGTYIDPSLLKNLRETKNINGLDKLTKREFEVFVQSNSGKSDDKIALDLCVELSHVRNLKSRIAKKIKDENIDNIILKLINNSHPDLSHSTLV